jgi:D-glycero-alpha-D-manno-heptose-7-phosphate kinase
VKVRARAPLRLGLAGGGTDVSPFCDEHGGYVLNATIDMYAFASLELLDKEYVEFEAADSGQSFRSVAVRKLECNGPLALHCGVYNRIVREFNNGMPFGVRVVTHSDAPPGSGLGSSSTMVVTIVQAYVEALNLPLGEYEVARLAYDIERIDLGLAGGRQDQYAATFGGFNFMEFNAGERVLVNPLRVKPWIVNELEPSLMLFYTGVSRASATIISQQIQNMEERTKSATDAFLAVKEEAIEMKAALLKGDFRVFVESMRRGWASKKRTAASVSNEMIDEIYERAIGAGAQAGKVSGAGGGGFMMFFVDPAARPRVVRALADLPGQVYRFHFNNYGSQAWRLE